MWDGLGLATGKAALHTPKVPPRNNSRTKPHEGLQSVSPRHKILGPKAHFSRLSAPKTRVGKDRYKTAKIMHHTAPYMHTPKGWETHNQAKPGASMGHGGHTKVGDHVVLMVGLVVTSGGPLPPHQVHTVQAYVGCCTTTAWSHSSADTAT